METKKHVYDGMELPSYLGFGKLNEQSIRFNNKELYAEYVFEFDNSVVHTVKWSNDQCELQTYLHGVKSRHTQNPTLQKAMLFDCWFWKLEDYNCFHHLVNKTITLGNIYMNFPKTDDSHKSFCYYPAGKLFIFSLPVIQKSERYNKFLSKLNESQILKLFRELNGHLLIMDNDGVVISQPIAIAQFVVPLARVYSASKSIVDAGVIENSKHLRLIIDEACSSQKNLMQVFLGETQGSFYSIIFKEFSEIELEFVVKIFTSQVELLKKGIPDKKMGE